MQILDIVLILFLVLESLNVIALYFKPDFRQANAMGAFKAWQKAHHDPEVAEVVDYLVNWVAGTKLIFILLICVILALGDRTIKAYSTLALVIAIGSFYWRLFPLLRKIDSQGQISPSGYSKTLGLMILAFMMSLGLAAVYTLWPTLL